MMTMHDANIYSGEDWTMNSRHVTCLEVASGTTTENVTLSCATSCGESVLNAHRTALLISLLNHLIPAAAEMPAAGELDIAGSIKRVLESDPSVRPI